MVLGADNEPTVLDVTASTLEDIGCEVVTAPGGKDALKKLSTNERIEILITNINMPGGRRAHGDGAAVMAAWRAHRDRAGITRGAEPFQR